MSDLAYVESDGFRYRVTYDATSYDYDAHTGSWGEQRKRSQNETFVGLEHIRMWIQTLAEIGIRVTVVKVERQPVNPEWEEVPWP